MSKFTKAQVQQMYAESINILFGGAVKATPDQITPAVIEKVDIMVREIAECSQVLTELSFKLIFQAVVGYPVSSWADKYTNNLFIHLWLIHDPNGTVFSPIQDMLIKWVSTLMGHRRYKACINVARAKWRSAIEIELLGL